MGDQELALQSPIVRTVQPSAAALDAIRSGVRDAVSQGMPSSTRTRKPGDEFAKCEYCKGTVHYAPNPKLCVQPYRPCSNDCPAKKPKAIHIRCAADLARKCRMSSIANEDGEEEEDDGGPIGFECDVCKGRFEVNVTLSAVNMFVALCFNVVTYTVLVLALAFLCTGWVWRYAQFRAIVNGNIPPDPINNPALVFLNKTSHVEEVRRPRWNEFSSYNHCVATEIAERIIHQQWLLLHDEPDGGGEGLGAMNMEERLTAMFALLKENGDPENLSRYYWMCGGVGWWGRFSDYVETCFYATGYLWYALIISGFLYLVLRGLDRCCGGCLARKLRTSRARAVISVNGKPVSLASGQGRKHAHGQAKQTLGMRMIHKSE